MARIYLDYAATTPAHPDVVSAMRPYFAARFGNPSAIHFLGQEAREAVEAARASVAALIGAEAGEICFTSGGTEADNFALEGAAFAGNAGDHIITTVIEHHAVLETCAFLQKRGFYVTYLPVDKDGLVDPDDVRKAITPRTRLVSVMHANNEIGAILPLAEISRVTQEAGVLLHTDAVQTAGHVPVNVDELGVDLLSMSAHKLYGPKGIGALYIRKGTELAPLIHGGGQEGGRRSGTENVPGIVGFGKAAEITAAELQCEALRLTGLRDRLIAGIMENIEDTRLNGHPTRRLPNNVNISVGFVEGEAIILHLDRVGICASTGSACSSGSLEASHVLLATGCPPELARGSIRFTMGRLTTEADIGRVMEVLPGIVARLRAMSPLLKRK
jgi:cysteine desulfurase